MDERRELIKALAAASYPYEKAGYDREGWINHAIKDADAVIAALQDAPPGSECIWWEAPPFGYPQKWRIPHSDIDGPPMWLGTPPPHCSRCGKPVVTKGQ